MKNRFSFEKITMTSMLDFFKQYYGIILFVALVLFMYLANGFHESFPDEFDNILGGRYITRGILPYIGFFSHHNPGAYILASIITLFTRQSFVAFRVVFALVLFASSFGSYLYLKKTLDDKSTRFFIAYIFVIALSSTYFWGQMLLSETIVGYSFIPAYFIVILKYLHNKRLTIADLIVISGLTFLSLFTSMTFVFAIGLFLVFTVYYFLKSNVFSFKNILLAGIIFGAPYLLFSLYLIVTGSVGAYYFSSIFYNREYYIYNFPTVAGQVSKNPIRYALSILYETSLQFYVLFQQVKDFNVAYPVNITLLLGNVIVIFYFIWRRKFLLAGLVYLTIVYLNARGGPLNSKETDFHSTVYIMLSLAHISYIFYTFKELFNQKILQEFEKVIFYSSFGLLSIYSFFLFSFFGFKFSEKLYTKVMGRMPLIYDRPVVAPFINKIVSKDEYVWIGPFEFEELFYINGKMPSKYHWFLPANERSEKIRTEIVADLIRNKPKLIVFKEGESFFGALPQDFNYPIVNILKRDYFRIEDLEKEGLHYQPTRTGLKNFDIKVNFYYDKNRREEILDLLLREGIIEPVKI